MSHHSTVHLALGPRSYDIVVGAGLLADAGRHCQAVARGRRAIVVTDENVAKLHGPAVMASLAESDFLLDQIAVPAGETAKSFGHLERLLESILGAGIDRSTTVIALGGGVVGDLAGFAASVALRGIDLIQMPTTLLAQVDSSVGGKTAINTKAGKNLVGSFRQPRLVLADTQTLDTLPPRELLAGYAETAKYGLIDDIRFFDWLEAHGPAVLAGSGGARRQAVAACCTAKARVVAADETEDAGRVLLNLGHTFAHALELESGYGGGLLHGEAVAIGVVMAFDLSVRMGLCPPADLARIRRHWQRVGLPQAPPADLMARCDPTTLINHMQRDKKVRDGRPTFILARGIGQAFVAHDVTLDLVAAVLRDAATA